MAKAKAKAIPKASPPCKWKVVERSRNVHEFHLRDSLKAGDEAWSLWMADEHWDNPKCNLALLKDHHNEAAARGAIIVKVGDTYCAMQGKGDKRGDKDSVRPEHQHGNYLDTLVKTAADWYSPWRENIGLIGMGNHETSVYRYHETCLIERLCQSLRDKGGIVHKGGYSGFVRYRLSRHSTSRGSYVCHYNHGSGGGGPVTKGAIDYNRKAEYVVADAILMGHVHWKNNTPTRRISINNDSQIITDYMHYIRMGTYKDEYEDGYAGFHVEQGRGPRPLGGWWLRISVKHDKFHFEWSEAT